MRKRTGKRVTWVGRTQVLSDSHGPYAFKQNGEYMPCVCDPPRVTCRYHLRREAEDHEHRDV